MRQHYEHHAKAKLLATCLTLIVVAGLVMITDHLKSARTASAASGVASAPTTSSSTPQSATTPASSPSTSSYKDGTYSADSQYYVPHGYEDIKVTLTVQNGVVTGSQVTNSQNDPTSAEFQQQFASSYISQVVGKSISDIHLSYVAGASDTTNGFNDALSQIRTKAQA